MFPTTEIFVWLSAFSFSFSSFFSLSFAEKEDGNVLDLDKFALGGGIFGKSASRFPDPFCLGIGTLSRLLPKRFDINLLGDGGRNPREGFTFVIKLDVRYRRISKFE